jgi:hypothetical protein
MMTDERPAAADAILAFTRALPRVLLHVLDVQRAAGDIARAIELGHEPAELAGLVTYGVIGLVNADQTMRHRLRRYAVTPPDHD